MRWHLPVDITCGGSADPVRLSVMLLYDFELFLQIITQKLA